MNRARQRAEQARAELERSERALGARWQVWHARAEHSRPWLLAGIGFASGVAFATLPARWWARLGSVAFGGGARLARSALAPALLGPLWSNLLFKARSQRPP